MELPADWEMLQLSRDPAAGRCVFADRYQYRFEFNWRQVPGRPDFERMLSDYQARLTTAGGLTDPQPEKRGVWRGLRGKQGGRWISRLGAYFEREACLVEAVFIWPGDPDVALQRAILEGMQPEPPWGEDLRRWRAFGMDWLVSGGEGPAECRVQPASTHITFCKGKPPRQRETFVRLGLVPEWLKGTVRDWLALQKPADVSIRRRDVFASAGHSVEWVEGDRPVRGLGRLRGRREVYRAAAWMCPRDGRLYCISVERHAAPRAADLAGGRLSCCGDFPLRAHRGL